MTEMTTAATLKRLRALCERMNTADPLTDDERAFVEAMQANLAHDHALLGEMLAGNVAGRPVVGMPRLLRQID